MFVLMVRYFLEATPFYFYSYGDKKLSGSLNSDLELIFRSYLLTLASFFLGEVSVNVMGDFYMDFKELLLKKVFSCFASFLLD